jgi:hypothetical protein
MNPESPGFIRGGGDDPPLCGIPAHDYGLSFQGGIVPLLNGGVKSIHVDVQDFTHAPGFSWRWTYHDDGGEKSDIQRKKAKEEKLKT